LKDLLPTEVTVEVINQLFDQAIRDLPITAFAKRLLLRTIKDLAVRYLTGMQAVSSGGVPKLTTNEVSVLDSINEVMEYLHTNNSL
jgi:predicted lipid carrier protein YhbT